MWAVVWSKAMILVLETAEDSVALCDSYWCVHVASDCEEGWGWPYAKRESYFITSPQSSILLRVSLSFANPPYGSDTNLVYTES